MQLCDQKKMWWMWENCPDMAQILCTLHLHFFDLLLSFTIFYMGQFPRTVLISRVNNCFRCNWNGLKWKFIENYPSNDFFFCKHLRKVWRKEYFSNTKSSRSELHKFLRNYFLCTAAPTVQFRFNSVTYNLRLSISKYVWILCHTNHIPFCLKPILSINS